MEDINILNEICKMLNIGADDNIAIPTIFYKNHLLVNIEYFRGSDIYKFLRDKLFENCPQYPCFYKDEIYIYVGDVRDWLKLYFKN